MKGGSTKKSYTAGFTLFYAVLVSSLLLAMGLAILNITFKEFVLSSGARDSETAFYAADTALECALYWDTKGRMFGHYGDSLAEGLVGFWRFEDGTVNPVSIVAADSSGSSNHATLSDPEESGWTAGYIDSALSFDGSDDFVGVPDSTSLSFGTDPYTIMFWFKLDTAFGPTSPTTVPMFTRYTNDGRNMGAVLRGTDYTACVSSCDTTSYGGLLMKIESAQGYARYWHTNQTTWNANQWYHVAIVVTGSASTGEIYINGISDSVAGPSGAGTYNADNISAPWRWGQGNFDTANIPGGQPLYFDGMLDEIRIYNRPLTQAEIQTVVDNEILADFVDPVVAGDAPAPCAENDINDPTTGWWEDAGGNPIGWVVEELPPNEDLGSEDYWKTTFDVSLSNNTCALVEVYKDDSASTTIISRGYNTCSLNNPRRLERAIRAHY